MRKASWRVVCPVHGAIATMETWHELAMKPDGYGPSAVPWVCPVKTGEPYGSGPCWEIVSVEAVRRRWWQIW